MLSTHVDARTDGVFTLVEPVVPTPVATGNASKKKRIGLKSVVVLVDLLAVACAMVAALGALAVIRGEELARVSADAWAIGACSLAAWMFALSSAGLYQLRFLSNAVEEFRRVLRAATVATIGTACAGFALKLDASRAWLALSAAFVVCALWVARATVRRGLARRRREGHYLRPVLIVGGNDEAAALARSLDGDPTQGYRVEGFVYDGPDLPSMTERRLGRLDDIPTLARRRALSGVIVATSAVDPAVTNHLARRLTDAGIHVELSSSLRDIATRRLTVRSVDRCPLVHIDPVRRSGWRPAAKRAFDIVVSAGLLVLTSPLWLVTAAIIRLDSRGPIFFRQERVGIEGTRFEIRKFRTMVVDAEDLLVDLTERNEADGPLFKISNDPRITRVGGALRKLSIDELPQLLNVLRGEMSLVGPRPALPSEVDEWHEELHGRLRVKPGITGMWQVNGRSATSFEDYSRYDLYYVDNWSLAADIAILCKTVPAVVLSRGAS